MILRDDRPMTNAERKADWYAKAAMVDGYLTTGPRFMSDFDRVFGREYERQEMLSARPCILEE